MTITLELTPETEARLHLVAQAHGFDARNFDIQKFLQEYLPVMPLPAAQENEHPRPVPPSQQEKDNLAAWFQLVQVEDAKEQQETLAVLQKGLAESPFSLRDYALPHDYGDK